MGEADAASGKEMTISDSAQEDSSEKAKSTFLVESLSHCNEFDYVLACHPDRKRLNSCLGSNQLLVSAIDSELSRVDNISAWNDICWILAKKRSFL